MQSRKKYDAKFQELNNEKEEVTQIQRKQEANLLHLRKMGAKPFIWKWNKMKGGESIEQMLNKTWSH